MANSFSASPLVQDCRPFWFTVREYRSANIWRSLSSSLTVRSIPRRIFEKIRRSRSVCLTSFNCASASAERLPCLNAFLLPLGAPGLVPPCIRHLDLPLTTGVRHEPPERVLAPHRIIVLFALDSMELSVRISRRREGTANMPVKLDRSST